MNNLTSFAALITLYGAIIAISWFIIRQRVRVHSLRDVVSRVALKIDSSQMVPSRDDRLNDVRHLVGEGSGCISALQFLNTLDKKRTILDQIGDISTSIFTTQYIYISFIAFSLALFLAPATISVLFALPPADTLVEVTAKRSLELNFVIMLAAASAFGVLINSGMVVLIWLSFFHGHVEQTIASVGHEPLWSRGSTPKLGNRQIVKAKDDPSFTSLKG